MVEIVTYMQLSIMNEIFHSKILYTLLNRNCLNKKTCVVFLFEKMYFYFRFQEANLNKNENLLKMHLRI